LSLRAEKNWAQNSGAKRLDDISCVNMLVSWWLAVEPLSWNDWIGFSGNGSPQTLILHWTD
jgi:hypothetical protein